MKHLMKRNNQKISAYLSDKQIESVTFNIILQQPTTENSDSDKEFGFTEAETNKCLIQHCIVV